MWEYYARVNRIVDGDTLELLVDLGFRDFMEYEFRLYGIDTPETHGVSKESEEYKAGLAAADRVLEWLGNPDVEPWHYHKGYVLKEPVWVEIRSHDGREIGSGKYGRWLVEVFRGTSNLNTLLVEEGHAERIT